MPRSGRWPGRYSSWRRRMLLRFEHFFDDIGDRLENHGVEPDLEVAEAPRADDAPDDPQLDAALRRLPPLVTRKSRAP
ncbi:MAG TPA: hypothetical protein VFN97_26420 [Actinospica sp.]|nr:hypothetical protein [Actinospica sp.]